MKVKIKSFNGELPDYLTYGKVYIFDGGWIYADDGYECLICVNRCLHLNGGSWEVVE